MNVEAPIRLAAGAFVVIGAGALIAPRTAARAYGVPSNEPSAQAYVRATGARDLAFGAVLLAVTQADRAALRKTCWWSAAVAVCDAAIVYREKGSAAAPSLAIHGGGALAFAVLALLTR